MRMEDQDIIQEIEKRRRFGSLPGSLMSRQLLAAAGNPQQGLAFLHIAGTNGKGSVAAFLRSVLKEAGIKAGVFTSPHLTDFTERIQVDGKRIPMEDAARLGRKLLELKLKEQPAMFDLCLAMALLYFKEQGCRLAVLETGLGGRLDSTNAAGVPLVSIITKIGYDHMAVLGSTLEEIAQEKAGILKKGTRAVFGCQAEEVYEVLKKRCRELDIPFQSVEASKIVPLESGFVYPGERPYRMKMLGGFQRENAAAAVLSIRELIKLGFPITENALHQGIAAAYWNGRMELVCKNPYLFIDGAHNEDGVAALVSSLKELYPGEKFHFIMGVLEDKDYKKMADLILPLAAEVTTAAPKSSRALRGEILAEYIKNSGVKAEYCEDIRDALAVFLQDSGSVSPRTRTVKTVLFGSLYFIGEVRKFFHLPL